MNGPFQNAYVRTFGGEPGISISLVTPNDGNGHGGCWFGNIYNFLVGGWEQKFTYCGGGVTYSIANNDGWTAWESYNLISPGNCQTFPSIRGQLIQLYVSWSGGVQYLEDFALGTSTTANYCWTNFGGTPYTFDWPSGTPGTWRARTPNP